MTKASEKICDVLIEAGIDHVFGMPGGGMTDIWESMSQRMDKFKLVLVRHEQAASCMADMYGRLTGKPAVLIGQGPFIGSIGLFGIFEAFMSCSPMLVLTDTSEYHSFSQHVHFQCGTGEYGSLDLRNILKGTCKYLSYAVTPEEAVHGVQLAIKHAISPIRGPACVLMRMHASAGEVNSEKCPRIFPTEGYLRTSLTMSGRSDLEKAAELLIEARNPVIIAGNGVHVSNAYNELRQLAELLCIPVATSYKGKSTFPEVHPLSIGMMGSFGHKIAKQVIAKADILLVAGSRLSPNNTLSESPRFIDPQNQKIIQIDVEPRNAGWSFPIEIGLIGDLKLVLQGLLEVLSQKKSLDSAPCGARERVLARKKQESGYFEASEMHSDAIPILPQRLCHELNKAVSPSTILTIDAGNNRVWPSLFFQAKEVRTFFPPGGIGGMGWSPAAALGAQFAEPEKPILSLSGDGGFGMMLHVLSTAVQYGLPVTFVVMNNSKLGMVQDLHPNVRHETLEFISTDFANIALAFNCEGIRIEKPKDLAPSIKKSLRNGKPTVLDVVISRDESILQYKQS